MIISIDLGGTNLRAASVDENGDVLKIERTKSPVGEHVIPGVVSFIEKTFKKEELKVASAIAVSVAGKVDPKKGSFWGPNIWPKDIDVSAPLKKAFGKPVFLINDADAAVYAEYVNRGEKIKNLAYITLSTGIGVGVIREGKLVGEKGDSPELGHLRIDEKEYSLLCSCGEKNHWESFSSGARIPVFFKEWAKKKEIDKKGYETAKVISEKAERGDKVANDFMNELGKYNAEGVKTIIHEYHPELIILGGAVVREHGDKIIEGIKAHMPEGMNFPRMEITKLGDKVCLLGAALYALNNLE